VKPVNEIYAEFLLKKFQFHKTVESENIVNGSNYNKYEYIL
jgi:hypothetical protein